MKNRILIGVSFGAAMAAALLLGQNVDINSTIVSNPNKPALAVIDFHGAGGADPLMKAFNTTLMADLQSSALFDLKSKSFFPASYPQQPSDLVPQDNGQGKALSDWAGPPVSASHLCSVTPPSSTAYWRSMEMSTIRGSPRHPRRCLRNAMPDRAMKQARFAWRMNSPTTSSCSSAAPVHF